MTLLLLPVPVWAALQCNICNPLIARGTYLMKSTSGKASVCPLYDRRAQVEEAVANKLQQLGQDMATRAQKTEHEEKQAKQKAIADLEAAKAEELTCSICMTEVLQVSGVLKGKSMCGSWGTADRHW